MTVPFAPLSPVASLRLGPRPPSLLAGAVFQVICASLMTCAAVFIAVSYVQTEAAIREAARLVPVAASAVDSERDVNLVGSVVFFVLAVMMALWLGLPVWWLWRGSNLARIFAAVAAWLLGAVGVVLVVVVVVALVLAVTAMATDSMTDPEPIVSVDAVSRFQDAVIDAQSRRFPSGAVCVVCMCLASVLSLVAAVTLVLPSTKRWYRPRAAWPVYPPAQVMLGHYAQPGPISYQR